MLEGCDAVCSDLVHDDFFKVIYAHNFFASLSTLLAPKNANGPSLLATTYDFLFFKTVSGPTLL